MIKSYKFFLKIKARTLLKLSQIYFWNLFTFIYLFMFFKVHIQNFIFLLKMNTYSRFAVLSPEIDLDAAHKIKSGSKRDKVKKENKQKENENVKAKTTNQTNNSVIKKKKKDVSDVSTVVERSVILKINNIKSNSYLYFVILYIWLLI